MNKANQLYWQAKGYQKRLQELAVEFYNECIEDFEKNYAEEGSFSAILYSDDIPDVFRYNFKEFIIPLFKAEGFKVIEYSASRYGYTNDGWEISWDLKEGEIQDE